MRELIRFFSSYRPKYTMQDVHAVDALIDKGLERWETEAKVATTKVKLRQVNETLLEAAETFEQAGLNDQAQAIREARWKIVDRAL